MTASARRSYPAHYAGQVRVVERDGQPWFVAADVGEALGIGNVRQSLVNFPESEKAGVSITDVRSENGVTQRREVTIVNEAGLYRLIFQRHEPRLAVAMPRGFSCAVRRGGTTGIFPVPTRVFPDVKMSPLAASTRARE